MSALTEIMREIAQPEFKPAPVSIRRGPLEWVDYPLEDFQDSGWSLNVGYRWSRESREDRIEIDIVALELWTPAGTTAIDPSAFKDADRERVEDAIREHIEQRAEAQGDWLRDDRADYEMDAARDRRALRNEF